MKRYTRVLTAILHGAALGAVLPSLQEQRTAIYSAIDQLNLSTQDIAWLQQLQSNETLLHQEQKRAIDATSYFCPCGDLLGLLCGGFGPYNKCRCNNSLQTTCNVLQFPICISPNIEKCEGLADTDAAGTNPIPENLGTLIGALPGASNTVLPGPAFQPTPQYSPQQDYAPSQQYAPQYLPQAAQPQPQAGGDSYQETCIKGYNPQCGTSVCLRDPRVLDMAVNICVPPTTYCAGSGNALCPQNMLCVDDPRDNCNPRNGGRSCVGICV